MLKTAVPSTLSEEITLLCVFVIVVIRPPVCRQMLSQKPEHLGSRH
jgi:hypothetical protein